MTRYPFRLWVCTLMIVAGTSIVAFGQQASPASQSEPSLTLKNLETAFYGETNEHARYLAYASKADEEGYFAVAALLRAIGRGEEIHAANLGALITKTHAVPAVDLEPTNVRSTPENLESCLAEQKYEKDDMYPQFQKQARSDDMLEAARVFERNMAAEPRHLAWCQQALDNLADFKNKPATFLVCPTCGNTIRPSENAACQVCSTPRNKFESVH
jgi:rubrerythrin